MNFMSFYFVYGQTDLLQQFIVMLFFRTKRRVNLEKKGM